ncbi:MAG: 2-oxoacid:acceptor oxidoreductase family protein [Oscillospiraceae bacterium]|jgi:2-oxoglutarate ferredoxin oxidoreductase subunit gamma|nr:2-oxoacid:acceptor oxidoreductase family protein [Oscillospiraceae bacterium]
MMTQILLAGFGGQGILFTGKFLAYAGLLEDREVSWLPSYGPEMRGGTANCSVILSDEAIGSPIVLRPDVLMAMNLPSFSRFAPLVRQDGFIFADSSMFAADCGRTDVVCHYVPATQLAANADLDGLANMILLGKLLRVTELCRPESIRKAMEKTVPPRKQQLFESNLKALALGADFGIGEKQG